MRHTHLDLRRQTQRKLLALGSKRQRLLNQRKTVDEALGRVERLTAPLMALLAEIDAQLGTETPAPPVPAATPLLGQGPMRALAPRPVLRVEGLWKP